MALQENKAEPKAKAPEPKAAEKSEPKVAVKSEPKAKDGLSATDGITNSSLQDTNNAAATQDTLDSSSGGGYGMYIFLGLMIALFGFFWQRGYLQAFRKYLMETREQLRKATWPTREELYQHTVVVLLSTFMMGVFTIIADQTAALLVWDLLLQVPTSIFGKLF
jgi:preprotein translocase SecE subunit